MLTKEIKQDLFRYTEGVGIKDFLQGMRSPGFKFTFFYRKYKNSKKYSPMWFLYRCFYSKYFVKYGFQIPVAANIKGGVYMPHFGNIIINSKATIGENCNIAHTITIGKTDRGKNKGVPNIGDYVFIGTGSVIVGNIRIGNNVLIAPNSFVNFDIPDNTLFVAGNMISKENATKDYINRTLI